MKYAQQESNFATLFDVNAIYATQYLWLYFTETFILNSCDSISIQRIFWNNNKTCTRIFCRVFFILMTGKTRSQQITMSLQSFEKFLSVHWSKDDYCLRVVGIPLEKSTTTIADWRKNQKRTHFFHSSQIILLMVECYGNIMPWA